MIRILFYSCIIVTFLYLLYTYRNDKVIVFMSELKIMAFTSSNYEEAMRICNKYSFNKLCFSFKPLTLEAWFTPKEIQILKG